MHSTLPLSERCRCQSFVHLHIRGFTSTQNPQNILRCDLNFFVFSPSLLLSSSTFRTFYAHRPSGQAVVTGVVPFPPRYVPSIFIAHRVQHSHCSSILIKCCKLTLSRFPLRKFITSYQKDEYFWRRYVNNFYARKVPVNMCTR